MPTSPKRRNSKARSAREPLAPPLPFEGPRAVVVRVARTKIVVTLDDGRVLEVPLRSLPGLAAATPAQRRTFELVGGGIGIHFPLCDEDISVANLLQPELTMQYRR
jgi:hypothetical protein